MIEEVECPECLGSGYTTTSDHGCDGSDRDCYNTCPAPVQTICLLCGGDGVVPINVY